MAFERLQGLGEERFRKILNALMRGDSAMGTARMIQQEWKEFQDVKELTLTQQLNRLRTAAANNAFGKTAAAAIQAGGTPQIEMLKDKTSVTITRMEELALWRREVCEDLQVLAKKDGIKTVSSVYTSMFNDYANLLKDIQKIRYDLGLDLYCGPLGGAKMGAVNTVTLPDGTTIQQAAMTALAETNEILDKYSIPE